MISNHDPGKFHRSLHGWFRKNGRDLPWRRSRDPYAVLVSEFMLQQTTVAAVIPFYVRWMKRFPDIASLAGSDEETVLKLWEGLGYYSRARNLRRAAQEIVACHGGVVPDRMPELLQLPGIGPYTASAIAAFSFDRPVPVLDANIIRVVARLFDFRKPVTDAKGKYFIEQAARSLLPQRGGYLHASSLMELGALICKAGRPDCPSCPVRTFCRAVSPEKIPFKPPRKVVIHERDLRVFARAKGGIFLVPSAGPRWKGLWLLPPTRQEGEVILELSCIVTRHRIRMEISRARPRAGWKAFDPANLPPMPTPHRRALAILLEQHTGRARLRPSRNI
ncbi:MAG: A/G-specific adenine glycosylase [Verrucomicrobia bacterium]|nr:A/G-specific adenine glycosylase [Verrucomicrobiota bacterium]